MLDAWSKWFSILGAIATAIVAFSAIWGDWVRGFIARPKLKATLKSNRGDAQPTSIGGDEKIEAWWYHVEVRNLNRRFAPANGIVVNLVKVETSSASGEPVSSWEGEIPLKRRHGLVRDVLGPPIDFDLVMVSKETGIVLQTQLYPNNLQAQYMRRTTLWLTLRASATEIDSDFLRIKVSWDPEAERHQERFAISQ